MNIFLYFKKYRKIKRYKQGVAGKKKRTGELPDEVAVNETEEEATLFDVVLLVVGQALQHPRQPGRDVCRLEVVVLGERVLHLVRHPVRHSRRRSDPFSIKMRASQRVVRVVCVV